LGQALAVSTGRRADEGLTDVPSFCFVLLAEGDKKKKTTEEEPNATPHLEKAFAG
jgi:hypothetical protein